MTKKGRFTCCRGLLDFKNGCPEKYGTYPDGCSCWVEMTVQTQEGKTEVIKGCQDHIMLKLQRDLIVMMERNFKTTVDLRNGLCETRGDKTVPKADPMLEHLLCLMQAGHNEKLPKRLNETKELFS